MALRNEAEKAKGSGKVYPVVTSSRNMLNELYLYVNSPVSFDSPVSPVSLANAMLVLMLVCIAH